MGWCRSPWEMISLQSWNLPTAKSQLNRRPRWAHLVLHYPAVSSEAHSRRASLRETLHTLKRFHFCLETGPNEITGYTQRVRLMNCDYDYAWTSLRKYPESQAVILNLSYDSLEQIPRLWKMALHFFLPSPKSASFPLFRMMKGHLPSSVWNIISVLSATQWTWTKSLGGTVCLRAQEK